jgi:hypothetical protein
MKKFSMPLGSCWIGLLLSMFPTAASGAPAAQRPNIVLIFADDLGWQETGFMGSDFLYHEEWQLDGGRDKLDTNAAVELYNIADDLGEQSDLALTNRAKRDELLADLLDWIARVPAPLPTEANPDYRPGAKPAAKVRSTRTPREPR